jgi:hypothetical protein
LIDSDHHPQKVGVTFALDAWSGNVAEGSGGHSAATNEPQHNDKSHVKFATPNSASSPRKYH